MLNVWIGNLGKYNEGELVGEWLELPVSKKELDTFLREKVGLQLTQDEVEKALAENGVCYEEYMINDYETDLPIKVSEYTNLTMLNLLALASERVNNMEAVEAYIDSQGTDDIEEIINMIYLFILMKKILNICLMKKNMECQKLIGVVYKMS